MSLKILIIGQGGREHAMAWKLSKSDRIDSVFVAPGNGGTFLEKNVTNVDIKPTDTEDLIKFVKKTEVGAITEPIPIAGGILILKVENKRVEENEIDLDKNMKELIEIEKNKQLNNFSTNYFNQVKNNTKIKYFDD